MIRVYTDGACSQLKNTGHGPGGWGAIVLIDGQAPVELSGGERDTTNNRMELQAAIEGLRYLGDVRKDVTVYTDSAYLCNCITNGWYKKWMENGWYTSAKKPVENRDRWETILGLISRHNVKFSKVKGHANDVHNNRCDQLATSQVPRFR